MSLTPPKNIVYKIQNTINRSYVTESPQSKETLMVVAPNDRPSRTALSSQAYEILKRQIVTCVLHPGQRLIEKDICQSMSISRTPLREALNRLNQEGLVTVILFRGYVVSRLTSEDVQDLCELRCILETEAAGLAAQRSSPKECEHLQKVANIVYVPGDRKTYLQYLEVNLAFHSMLASCAHNRRLETAVVSVLHEIQRPLYFGLDVGLDPQTATAEHIEVVEAVQLHNPRHARALVRKQIMSAKERMLEALRAQEMSEAGQAEQPGHGVTGLSKSDARHGKQRDMDPESGFTYQRRRSGASTA